MRWQCTYHNVKGVRCVERALLRLHFSDNHPFDFVDVCDEHKNEYTRYVWSHLLTEDWNDKARASIESSDDFTRVLVSIQESKKAQED